MREPSDIKYATCWWRCWELDEISVEIEAMVYPTEDQERVFAAINNLVSLEQVSGLEIRPGIQVIRGKSMRKESLVKLQNLIRQDRIRDAARSLLHASMTANGLLFYLNKQVAFVNHVSFCDVEGESPLGPITVKIECSDPTMLIDWLAPSMQNRAKE